MDIIYPEFLSSPKALFNLLYSNRGLRGLSGVTALFYTFVLTFAGLGDTQGFIYLVPSGYTGFFWFTGYRVSAGLEGKLAMIFKIDGETVMVDPSFLRPQIDYDFTHFQRIDHEASATWVAGVAGQLQCHIYGMLMRDDFYAKTIEPLFAQVAKDMGVL